MHTESYSETLEGKGYLCDAGLNGRLIIKLVETVCEDIDWIHLAQKRDQWQILKNMVINIRVP
jgi:hypothetical protein